jgi:hypothetical protein
VEEPVGKMDEKNPETCARYGAVDAYTPPNHDAPSPAGGGEEEETATYAVNAAKATASTYTASLARRPAPAAPTSAAHAMPARPLCFHRPFIPPRANGLRPVSRPGAEAVQSGRRWWRSPATATASGGGGGGRVSLSAYRWVVDMDIAGMSLCEKCCCYICIWIRLLRDWRKIILLDKLVGPGCNLWPRPLLSCQLHRFSFVCSTAIIKP